VDEIWADRQRFEIETHERLNPQSTDEINPQSTDEINPQSTDETNASVADYTRPSQTEMGVMEIDRNIRKARAIPSLLLSRSEQQLG
jgi:hypothetical protein